LASGPHDDLPAFTADPRKVGSAGQGHISASFSPVLRA
jgi:hypothetical protein